MYTSRRFGCFSVAVAKLTRLRTLPFPLSVFTSGVRHVFSLGAIAWWSSLSAWHKSLPVDFWRSRTSLEWMTASLAWIQMWKSCSLQKLGGWFQNRKHPAEYPASFADKLFQMTRFQSKPFGMMSDKMSDNSGIFTMNRGLTDYREYLWTNWAPDVEKIQARVQHGVSWPPGLSFRPHGGRDFLGEGQGPSWWPVTITSSSSSTVCTMQKLQPYGTFLVGMRNLRQKCCCWYGGRGGGGTRIYYCIVSFSRCFTKKKWVQHFFLSKKLRVSYYQYQFAYRHHWKLVCVFLSEHMISFQCTKSITSPCHYNNHAFFSRHCIETVTMQLDIDHDGDVLNQNK